MSLMDQLVDHIFSLVHLMQFAIDQIISSPLQHLDQAAVGICKEDTSNSCVSIDLFILQNHWQIIDLWLNGISKVFFE